MILPTVHRLQGDDIAVGDVILNVWPDSIEAMLVTEVTVEPNPVTIVQVRGQRRVAWNDGLVGRLHDSPVYFGKESRQPVASTMFDCTGDWRLA